MCVSSAPIENTVGPTSPTDIPLPISTDSDIWPRASTAMSTYFSLRQYVSSHNPSQPTNGSRTTILTAPIPFCGAGLGQLDAVFEGG